MRYAQILNAIYNQPWAILPETLDKIDAVIQLRLSGAQADKEEIAAAVSGVAATSRVEGRHGMTAVLPLFGVIVQHAGLMTEYSGGTSTEAFARQFRQALADPQVDRIVINTHSPGGSVYGVAELSSLIHQSRGQKPVVAVANSLMASAAYWIATAADEVVATPGADVGSVGVLTMHTDVSKAEELSGLKTTLIAQPPGKIEGHPYEPLGEEARSVLQAGVDQSYGEFVAALSRNRGVSKKTVQSDFGQGRVLSARDALAAGMIDRIATLDEVLSGAGKKPRRSTRGKAALRLAEEG